MIHYDYILGYQVRGCCKDFSMQFIPMRVLGSGVSERDGDVTDVGGVVRIKTYGNGDCQGEEDNLQMHRMYRLSLQSEEKEVPVVSKSKRDLRLLFSVSAIVCSVAVIVVVFSSIIGALPLLLLYVLVVIFNIFPIGSFLQKLVTE